MPKSLYTLVLTVILATFLVLGCAEKEEVFNVVVKGTLYDSCGGSPLANAELEIGDAGSRSDNIFVKDEPSSFRGTVITDENGNFSFTSKESIGNGYIMYNNFHVCFGSFSLYKNEAVMDVGDLYVIPIRKPTNYHFVNIREWKNGEYVVAQYYDRDYQYIDTFDASNSSISGNNLNASGQTLYGIKVINSEQSNIDTTAMVGVMSFKWKTNKHYGTESHTYYTQMCNTDTISLRVKSDL